MTVGDSEYICHLLIPTTAAASAEHTCWGTAGSHLVSGAARVHLAPLPVDMYHKYYYLLLREVSKDLSLTPDLWHMDKWPTIKQNCL